MAISIGGSDAAAAAGLNRYKSPIALWSELVEGVRSGSNETQASRWGTLLEEPIRSDYAARRGAMLWVPQEPLYHEEHRWRRASPDAVLVNDPWLRGRHHWEMGLEVKTAGHYVMHRWGESDSQDIPVEYEVQVRWYMHVLGLPRWDLVALIAGQDLREYTFTRDLEAEGLLVAAVERFWVDHILTKTPPAPDGSDAYYEHLLRRFPKARGEFLKSTPEIDHHIAILRYAKESGRASDALIRVSEQELVLAVGEAAGIESEEHGRITMRPRKGQPSYKSIMEELQVEHGIAPDRICELLEKYRGEGSRPVLTPRSWNDPK